MIRIPYPAHYDFQQQRPLLARLSEILQQVETGNGYRRALRLPDRSTALIELQPRPDHLQVDVLDTQDGATAAAIETYVRQWLDLDRNLAPFVQLADQHPQLAPIVGHYPGLRLVRTPDLHEALIWAIVGQQMNTAVAAAMKRRLIENFGHQYPGTDLWIIPDPEVLASVDPAMLLPLKLSGNKAKAVVAISAKIASGELSQLAFDQMTDDEVYARLLAEKGLGPWTANYILLRSMGRVSRAPYGDAVLYTSIQRLLGLAQKPTEQQARAFLAPFADWEGYATVYLWRARADGLL